MPDIHDCRKIATHMKTIRDRREPAWIELSKWIGGGRGVFDDMQREDAWDTGDITLFRAAVAQAIVKGASGITGGMTPRNASWFKPALTQSELEEVSGARQWLYNVDVTMKDCLANGGFYQAIQQFNTDLLWAGCALLYSETSSRAPLRFECIQTGTYCIAANTEGELDCVVRQLRMTPRQMEQLFGRDRMSDAAVSALEKEPYSERIIWQMVRPKTGQTRNAAHNYESLYWEDRADKFLRTGGFHEMPFFFAVWTDAATPYGTGPGDLVLADAKQIDRMERYKLAGMGKLVDPPMAVPHSMKEMLDLSPGAINYVSAATENVVPIINLAPYAAALEGLQLEIDKVSKRVQDGLMSSLFASIPMDQRPANMSATEFLERKREAMQELGPVISAYEPSVLTPLLYRVVQTLDREGMLPPIPPQLQGQNILMKMEFISPMANALRQTGAESARALLVDVSNMLAATQNPEILDKIDFDQAVDELATGIGAPAGIVRSDEDVAKIRQARQQAQAEQAQMMQMQQAMQMAQSAQGIQTDARRMELDEARAQMEMENAAAAAQQAGGV